MSIQAPTLNNDELIARKSLNQGEFSPLGSPVLSAVLKSCAIATFVFGSIPFFFISWLILSTGANTICVDYAAFLHIVDKVLSGQYQWFSIFSDSFIRTHMVLLPVLVHIAVAYITNWNVTAELFIGMSLHLLRAFLIVDMIAGRYANKWIRLAVTGIVLALVFANSQSCIMIYGEASIAIGLCLLSFTFAIWSLCKFGRTPRGLSWMVLGGVASCYSFGNVVPVWAVLLLAIWLLPVRGWTHHFDASKSSAAKSGGHFLVNRKVACVYWLVGAVASLTPYIYFLSIRGSANPELVKTFGIVDGSFVLNALGRPFAKSMGMEYGRLPQAELSALILIALMVAAVIPLFRRQVKLDGVRMIGLLLFAYGFISVWSVGVFRTHVAPWYASMSLYCWLGLITLSIANLSNLFESNIGKRLWARPQAATISGALAIVCVMALFLSTNLTYKDKQFFLNARAPVSAEYVRFFNSSPTFLESSIFSNDGRPDRITAFASALNRHRLCIFAPQTTMSLQGQFALEQVSIERSAASKRVAWLEDRSLKKSASWRDYHHLNLSIPEGNTVNWRVTVPSDAEEMVFCTSVAAMAEPTGACADGAPPKLVSTVSIFPNSPDTVRVASGDCAGASYVVRCDDAWKPVRLNLLPYRGKSVTIRLGSSTRGSAYARLCKDGDCLPGSVVYMYPHITEVVSHDSGGVRTVRSGTASNTTSGKIVSEEFCPSNTDVSPLFPHLQGERFDFPNLLSQVWKKVELPIPADASHSMPGRYWDVEPKTGIPIDSYEYLTMNLAPLPGKTWCSLKMHLQFDDGTIDGFSMPLLPDTRTHSYVYPLRLLTVRSGAKLVRVVAFASAVDQKNLPFKHRHRKLNDYPPIASLEQDQNSSNQCAELCGCIQVNSIALASSTLPSRATVYQMPSVGRTEDQGALNLSSSRTANANNTPAKKLASNKCHTMLVCR
ncbi:MAG: hypothetical protein K2X93_11305 [Candidatus Obscuribacterales bacterium]|nr:hypothetical protein [Candidatus Obscuribacterales bacterium]